ncbi:MAG: cupredoxin domain-containing protein [Methylobacterium sp.]|nr:cupredoxin domain-containing protein [Methylobacterium sp.]
MTLAALVLSGGFAAAQTKAPPKNDGTMPPISIVAEEVDGRLQCSPAELRLPAETNVQFEIVNKTKEQVTLTAPDMFKNRNVLHHDGDLVHVASNDGYLIKQGGNGVLRVRTLAEGQYPYGCTAVSRQREPFRGTLTLTRANP